MQIIYESNNNLCYAPIPKNASMWGNKIFKDYLNFESKKYVLEKNLNKKFIIFLRDPLDRWISGITQFLWQLQFDDDTEYFLKNKNFILDPLHISLIFSKIEFDTHSMSQVSFLHEFLPSIDSHHKLIYFYVNDVNFSKQVAHFLYSNYKIKIPTSKIHETAKNKLKVQIRKQIKDNLNSNPKHLKFVMKVLQKDYELISNCNFYTIYNKQSVI